MGTLTFPGLTSGIDTASLIKQMVAAESGQLTTLQHRRGVWQDKSSAYGTLETRLKTLVSATDELRDASHLQAYSISSNNQDVLTASASSSAAEGFHQIVINRLASAERDAHTGVATADTLVGVGTFSYTYGTGAQAETRTIQTTDETTLSELADLINNDSGNPGVTASLLEYDAGGDQVFHLVLSGDDSGADYTLAINDAQTTLDGTNGTVDFRQASFTETQQALDSQLQVDGYPSGDWIQRSGNTIDDVLPGVTLQLHATGTVSLSLSRETDDLKTKVQDMVDAYNNVVDFIQTSTAYDQKTDTAGVLIGDYTLTHVRTELRTMFVESLPGFQDGQDSFTLSGQLGLSVNRDGQMVLDTSDFDDAISEDYLGVLSALGAQHTGTSDDEYLKFFAAMNGTEPGSYDVKATFDGTGNLVSAQVKLSSESASAWRAATVDGNIIIGDADSAEAGLRVTASWDGVSQDQTAQVRVRQGLAGKLYDAVDGMLDSTDGAVGVAQLRCDSAIDLLDTNIKQQEDRLEKIGKRLTRRFARLEATLTKLQAQRSALGM